MKTFHIDIETVSVVDVRKTGAVAYAMNAGTDILCVCYSADGEDEVHVWTPGMDVPDALKEPFHMVAHNVSFERAIWTHIAVKRYGFVMPASYECTMIAAFQRNFPGSLDYAAKALGVSDQKDKEGRKVMLKMTKHDYHEKLRAKYARQTRRKTKPIDEETAERLYQEEVEEDARQLIAYCQQDVRTEKAIHEYLKMKDVELFNLDAKINDRGIWCDIITVNAIQKCIEKELERLNKELEELTDGRISSGKQVGELTMWLRERGYPRESIDKSNIAEVLENPEGLDEKAIRALQIRKELSLGSVGKYKAMQQSYIPETGRVHNLIQFRGASQTGRYAGRRIQMQNLPRLNLSPDEKEADKRILELIDLFRRGRIETIRMMYGDVFYAAKQMIRPMFGSPRGLIVSDFAQIEARVVAWLAGEQDTLDAFANPNRDPYVEMASVIYGVPEDKVTKDQRHMGKTVVLGAGFQLGGVGLSHQVDQTEEWCKDTIKKYRLKNPNIESFWWALDKAFCDIILGKVNSIELRFLKLRRQYWIGKDGKPKVGVTIELPSKRKLYYHNCRVGFTEDGFSRKFFTGENWTEEETYGGKLTENVVQAIANDLLNNALLELDKAGYSIVTHVHDEVVIENVSDVDVKPITSIMQRLPDWMKELPPFPLEAETKFCYTNRYTK